jgi:hypothetical protein
VSYDTMDIPDKGSLPIIGLDPETFVLE